ncbi:MAG: glycosyltransferase [Candidatus Aenigmatarchaeota archaeon]
MKVLPKVSVIVLSRDGKQLPEGILNQDYKDMELIKCKSDYKIYTTRNKIVKKANGDFILWIDDDAKIKQKDLITNMVKTFLKLEKKYCKVGAIQARRPWKKIVGETDYVCEGCLMIRKDTQLKYPFDESFCIMWGDVDLSYRLRNDGYKLFVIPEAEYHHPYSKPTKLKGYFYVRNGIVMNKRYGSTPAMKVLKINGFDLTIWKWFFLLPFLIIRHRTIKVVKAFFDGLKMT